MHHEHKVKRENQQDATNSMFIIKLSISTCFGHHYAHHQENKTVSYCMQCSAWVCRPWSCGAASWAVCTVWKLPFDCFTQCTQLMELRCELCALCESYCSTVSHSAHSSRRSSTRPQPTTAYTPRQNTTCSRTPSYSADDGHNDAWNMLR